MIEKFLFLVLAAVPAVNAQAVAPLTVDQVLSWRETAQYEVHYGPLLLGSVLIHPLKDTTYRGKPAWLAKSVVKSNPKLWFVGNREEHFYGLLVRNDTMLYEVEYWKDDIDSRALKEEHYLLDYERGTSTIKEKGKVVAVLPLLKPTICGMGFFYQGRLSAGTGRTVEIPMLVGRKNKPIVVNHTTEREKILSAAFGKMSEEETFLVTGKADIPGPFGFNGSFRGYMSARPERFPMDCFITVWVGAVHLKPTAFKIKK